MTDKIIVEFSRKELKKVCEQHDKKTYGYLLFCKDCKQDDKQLIKCQLIYSLNFKIKEQK